MEKTTSKHIPAHPRVAQKAMPKSPVKHLPSGRWFAGWEAAGNRTHWASTCSGAGQCDFSRRRTDYHVIILGGTGFLLMYQHSPLSLLFILPPNVRCSTPILVTLRTRRLRKDKFFSRREDISGKEGKDSRHWDQPSPTKVL